MKLVLHGKIPSKKNSKRIVRFGNRSALIGSQAYLDWKEAAGWEVLAWKNQQQGRAVAVKWAACRAKVKIDFWLADKRRHDLTNMAESIMDLLVDHLVLADDDCQHAPDVHLRFMGVDKADPRAMITITPSST